MNRTEQNESFASESADTYEVDTFIIRSVVLSSQRPERMDLQQDNDLCVPEACTLITGKGMMNDD